MRGEVCEKARLLVPSQYGITSGDPDTKDIQAKIEMLTSDKTWAFIFSDPEKVSAFEVGLSKLDITHLNHCPACPTAR